MGGPPVILDVLVATFREWGDSGGPTSGVVVPLPNHWCCTGALGVTASCLPLGRPKGGVKVAQKWAKGKQLPVAPRAPRAAPAIGPGQHHYRVWPTADSPLPEGGHQQVQYHWAAGAHEVVWYLRSRNGSGAGLYLSTRTCPCLVHPPPKTSQRDGWVEIHYSLLIPSKTP